MIGTPAYMSPEQIDRRSPVGLTSDIYSLGVVLYELLTQRCPFEGSVVSIVGQILHGEPPPIESRRENVSPELARLCRKAMSKNAAERFGSMQEFADALTAFVRGKQSATTGAKTLPDVPAEKQELLTPPLASPLQTTTVPRWRGFDFSPRLVGIVVTSAAAVLLVIGLAIFASRANRPTFAASNPNTTASAATPPALPPTAAPAATESAMPVVRSTSRELPPPPGAPLRLEDFRGKPVEENFKRLDRNGDGLITPSEAPLHIIRRADSNYDEAIDLPEMLDAFALLHEGLFAPPTDAERERLPAHFGGPEPRPRPGPPPGPRPGPPPGPPPGQGRPPPPRGPAPRQP
jgi:serine/threonine protein kinase